MRAILLLLLGLIYLFFFPFASISAQAVFTETPSAVQQNLASPDATSLLDSSATATETPTGTPTGTFAVSQTPTPTPLVEATITLTPEVTPSLIFSSPIDSFISTPIISTPVSISPLPEELKFTNDCGADEILIIFDTQKSETINLSALSGSSGSISDGVNESLQKIGILRMKIPDAQIGAVISALQTESKIMSIEADCPIRMADIVPNDPNFTLQYGLNLIRAPQGWDFSTGSSAVTVAVLDTGVDLGHADLASKIVPGFDFVNNDAVAQDDNGHGTHVAGIAAAASNNGLGVSGVSWGARIMPVKVLNATGNGTFADVAAGIIWASDHGAQVLNLSLGGPSPSVTLQNAVNYAYSKGVLMVASSGNSGSSGVYYPAAYAHVIAVADVDNLKNRAGTSTYGPEIDLAAPGELIYSTALGGGYEYRSGTSMAAPFVSGLAAVLAGYVSLDGVEQILEASAFDLGSAGWDIYYGSGLIQADAALRIAQPATATSAVIPTGDTYLPDASGPGSDLAVPTKTIHWIIPRVITAAPTYTPVPGDTQVTPEMFALSGGDAVETPTFYATLTQSSTPDGAEAPTPTPGATLFNDLTLWLGVAIVALGLCGLLVALLILQRRK